MVSVSLQAANSIHVVSIADHCFVFLGFFFSNVAMATHCGCVHVHTLNSLSCSHHNVLAAVNGYILYHKGSLSKMSLSTKQRTAHSLKHACENLNLNSSEHK